MHKARSARDESEGECGTPEFRGILQAIDAQAIEGRRLVRRGSLRLAEIGHGMTLDEDVDFAGRHWAGKGDFENGLCCNLFQPQRGDFGKERSRHAARNLGGIALKQLPFVFERLSRRGVIESELRFGGNANVLANGIEKRELKPYGLGAVARLNA